MVKEKLQNKNEWVRRKKNCRNHTYAKRSKVQNMVETRRQIICSVRPKGKGRRVKRSTPYCGEALL